MSDELPVTDGAVDTPDPVDYEQRYKDTHANWNQLNEQMSRFKKDPNALIEFVQETHPDLLVGDEEPDPITEDPFVVADEDEQPMTRAEFKAWQQEQAQTAQATAAQNQFETDLKTFTGDRELSPQGEAYVRFAATKGEIRTPDDLQGRIDDWFTYEDGLKTSGRPKPRAPHFPANGSAATDVPNFDGMSRAEIDRFMAERAAGHLNPS